MSQIDLFQKVISFSRTFFPQDSSVVVAVSGGSDSVALLHILHKLQIQLNIKKLVAAHVNYSLRGDDSDKDELLVRWHAAALNVPFYGKRLQGHVLTEPGMENWARDERYAFLQEIRMAAGCSLIATGHTLDDQAETVIMRLLRGTGLHGLRGIAAAREDGVVRPLLSIQKREIVDWLDSAKIDYRYDVSNGDTRLLRNRVRHEILPLLETCHCGAIRHVAALAAEAQLQCSSQEGNVDEWIKTHCRTVSGDAFRIGIRGLNSVALASEALRRLFTEYGISPGRYHLGAILKMAQKRGATLLLPDGWSCAAGTDVLFFEKKKPEYQYTVSIPGNCVIREEGRQVKISVESLYPETPDCGKWTVYINGDMAGETCVFRSVKTDDTFVPFGQNRTVNVLQFLAKQGLLKPDREHTGIVTTSDDKIIWIHGIRPDNRFRISSGTKKVIKVQSSSFS